MGASKCAGRTAAVSKTSRRTSVVCRHYGFRGATRCEYAAAGLRHSRGPSKLVIGDSLPLCAHCVVAAFIGERADAEMMTENRVENLGDLAGRSSRNRIVRAIGNK